MKKISSSKSKKEKKQSLYSTAIEHANNLQVCEQNQETRLGMENIVEKVYDGILEKFQFIPKTLLTDILDREFIQSLFFPDPKTVLRLPSEKDLCSKIKESIYSKPTQKSFYQSFPNEVLFENFSHTPGFEKFREYSQKYEKKQIFEEELSHYFNKRRYLISIYIAKVLRHVVLGIKKTYKPKK